MRIAINGFGRVGRSVFRAIYENGLENEITVVAINELASPDAIAHLLQYDSSHGRFNHNVSIQSGRLIVDDKATYLVANPKIEQLVWDNFDIDIVFECTGVHKTYQDAVKHLNVGAAKVLFAHPADKDIDNTIIYGVNHRTLMKQHKVVSNGSCTSNCIIPVIKALDDAYTVDSGAITTIHSSMNDQQVIDAFTSDMRLTRAASQSIIPVNTKLSSGIDRILPHLKNRFEAISVRVPTTNVTAIDLSVTVKQDVNIDEVNKLLKMASQTQFDGVMGYTEKPLVSVDFMHDPRSSIIDGTQTRVSHKRLIKILAWCDNEWGFANRMIDTAKAMMNC